ncbi:CPBP family intramembrane metalloprotease [Clostridium perfringens]
MKKFFKTVGVCLGFPILNFLIVSFMQVFFLAYTKNNISLFQKNIFSLTILGDILTLVLITIILLPSNERLLRRIKIKKINLKEYFYIIALSIGVSILLLFLSGILSKIIPSYGDVVNQLNVASKSSLQLVIAIILIPIYEEIVFRGIIFGYLRKNFNIIVAVLVQALIFGIMHLNLVQGIYTFILGIVLALIYMYSDSILGNITVHIIFNLLGALIVPMLLSKFPIMVIVLLILGIVLFIFSVIKIIGKYEKSLYK